MRLTDKDALIEAMGEEPLVWNDEADEIAERMQWQIDMSIIEAAPTIERCEDAISREAIRLVESNADAYVDDWNDDYENGFLDAINKILALPSVAPKHSGEAAEMVEDAISIEVAIQTTWMILNGMGYPKDQNEDLAQTIKTVFDTAPRVAPSRPSGEWINMGSYEECKNCHEVKRFPHWDFCPNCGARMKGANDD